MVYKFKSAATGDVIMTDAVGDVVLGVLGRQPSARGILEVADMPAAIEALRRAAHAAPDGEAAAGDDDHAADERAVSLRARVWPLVEMIEAAKKAGEPIVWGV